MMWKGIEARAEKRISDEQKWVWLNKKGEIITTTWLHKYYGLKNEYQGVYIEWFSGDRPFYRHSSKYKTFCKNHFWIGDI